MKLSVGKDYKEVSGQIYHISGYSSVDGLFFNADRTIFWTDNGVSTDYNVILVKEV